MHVSAVLNWNPAYHLHVLVFAHLLANMPYKENLSPVLLPADQKILWKLALDKKWAHVLFQKKQNPLAGNREVICFPIKVDPAAASYKQWLTISIDTNCRGCENNCVGKLTPAQFKYTQTHTDGSTTSDRRRNPRVKLKPGPSVAVFHKIDKHNAQIWISTIIHVIIQWGKKDSSISRHSGTLRIRILLP